MANPPHRQWTLMRLGMWLAALVCALIVARYLLSPSAQITAEVESQPPPTQSPIVLPETAIRAGGSATTADGTFTVQVNRIAGKSVDLEVSSDTKDVYHFKKAEVGRRLVVPAPHGTYYVDLIRVSGNAVHLTISKQ